MVERIRTLLAARQLTPTQFADAINVGRPIVSHILSGRNKPSLEVVQKILAAFPDLSISWLLSGQGDMQTAASPGNAPHEPKTAQIPTERAPRPKRAVTRPSLFEEAEPLQVVNPPLQPSLHSPAASSVAAPELIQTAAVLAPVAETKSSPPEAMATIASGMADPAKVIRRIVIFYQDGTFSSYQPE